jgi:chromosome segregation ATPase
VRQARLDTVGKEYAAAQAALREALERVAESAKALADYAQQREEEEERRYRVALFSTMSRKDLDAFKAGLAALRDRENFLREELARREKEADEARTAGDEARERLTRARKDAEKVDMHRDAWLTERARTAEYRESLELEEFSGKKHGCDDDFEDADENARH